MKAWLLLAIVLLVAGCDQATKRWAEIELTGPPQTLIEGRLDLAHHENRGIAFNLERALPASTRTPLIAIAAAVALTALGVALVRRRRELSPRSVGYALVLAGALGNVIDRLARGYVVDFVHLHGWPVFNVADVAIGAGVACLLLDTYLSARPGASGSRSR